MPSELPDTTIGTIDTTVAIEKQRKRRETATLKKATKTTETTLENEIRAALSILKENSSTEDSDSNHETQTSRCPPLQPYCGEQGTLAGLPQRQALPNPYLNPYFQQASDNTGWSQQPPPNVFLATKINKLTLLVDTLTSRVEALESQSTKISPTESSLFLGESLSLTAGQQATLKCLSASQEWPYTLRKLLAILYEDLDLGSMCAVGKSGAKNTPMNKEDLGALKGI